jgi:uncharacterized protein Yka (UPF0111/DUF47 family)
MSSAGDRIFRPLARRLFPRVPDFHGLLAAQSEVALEALEELVAFLGEGEPDRGERVRALEKEGDRRRAETLATLAASFATPFDRGSIYASSVAIDDVVNYAKTTVRELEVLDVGPDDWMLRMAEELREGAAALKAGFERLQEDPDAATTAAVAAHKAERTVEKVYRAAVAEALAPEQYAERLRSGDAEAVPAAFAELLTALRRREIYRHLSNAADRLDEAGRALSDIVVQDV